MKRLNSKDTAGVKRYSIPVLMMLGILFAFAFSSCGDKGKTTAKETTDELGRLIISYAGEVDYDPFTADSVVCLRALDENGAPGQAFACVESFNEGRFMGEEITVELLKKNGFIVEFRDKTVLKMPLWTLDQGYNDVGVLDRSSTFVADNILETLKEKDIAPEDLAFFLGHFGDMEIPAAKKDSLDEEWKEWGASLRAVMKAWARRPDVFPVPSFPDDIFKRNVGATERKQRFDTAVAFLFVLDKDKSGELKRWIPRVFDAAVEMFAAETAEALLGKTPEPQKIRDVTGLMYELRDAMKAEYLPEDAELPETEYEAIDEHFRAKVMQDLRFDSRRRMGYLFRDIKEIADYDESAGPQENLLRFIRVFNTTVDKSILDKSLLRNIALKEDRTKKYLEGMDKALEIWMDEVYPKKEQAKISDDAPEAQEEAEEDSNVELEEGAEEEPADENSDSDNEDTTYRR